MMFRQPDLSSMPQPLTLPRSAVGVGHTWHERLRPCAHKFSYPLYFLMLPMRQLRDEAVQAANPTTTVPRNRWALISFYDRDHGEGGEDALAWVEQLLQQEGIFADGEIWLQTLPRVLGYVFKPVSFWLVMNREQYPVVILAEVNNTFGERHIYWLEVAADDLERGNHSWQTRLRAKKVFHVSPFCEVAGQYEFTLDCSTADAGRPYFRAQVDLHDDEGSLINTGIYGHVHPYSRAFSRRIFLQFPLLTLGVIVRIHWQALKLWVKRVPFFSKPAPPANLVSKSL